MARDVGKRSDYKHFQAITTRWMDNDTYGHVNNVIYYSWFDSAVNQFLIEAQVLDMAGGAVIGLVVETQCNYFAPVTFPDRVTTGIRVAKLGTSSVRYEVAVFCNEDDAASAEGHFVHVYVNRADNRPTALPDKLRATLETIAV